MKILVTGDREWTDHDAVTQAFVDLLREFKINPTEVILIHRDCRGADKVSDFIGNFIGMDVRPYPAEWSKFGRAAGPIRNKQMLDENPDIDLAFAFHPNLDKSKGTKDMVERLEKAEIEVRRIKA